MKQYLDFRDFLHNIGFSRNIEIYNGIIVGIILIIVAIISFLITRFLLVQILKAFIKKSNNDYDDVLIKQKVFDPISHIVPAIIFFAGTKYVTHNAATVDFIYQVIYSYLIIAFLVLIFRLLNALNDIYEIYAQKRKMTFQIKQYLQVLKIIFGITAIILIVSILFHKKPGTILTGFGAMTAVLILVFRDSILSLVASVQISAYKLLKVGDWITVPSKNVDGDVMDISLNTIKIRNFDKTISTIPTYTIVQDSFINWSGMQQTGGRRIARAINIDINSIKLCTSEMIEKYKNIHYITDYVTEKQKEIDEWNKARNILEPRNINGRSQTNIGVFRKYIEYYLKSNLRVYKKYKPEKFYINNKIISKFVIENPDELVEELGPKVKQFFTEINGKTVIKNIDKFIMHYPESYKLENNYVYKIRKYIKTITAKGTEVEVEDFEKIIEQQGKYADDLTILVRQLAPTEKGLPIQVYVFASTTVWADYESIQSDLFDHLFAVLPEFDLKVYQQPSSADLKLLAND